MSGTSRPLSDAEVKEIELRVGLNGGTLADREQLVWNLAPRHLGKDSPAEPHALWIVQNCPKQDAASWLLFGSRAVAAAWNAQVERAPSDAVILGHAARYFRSNNRRRSHELYSRAEAADPANPRWPWEHGELYQQDAAWGEDPGASTKANEAFERARALQQGRLSLLQLDKMADAAFAAGDLELARSRAEEILARLPSEQRDWNTGNLIHDAHSILGRVALRGGDVAAAKHHLLESGKTPGSPQLNSFGPRMVLASELLERGETQIVLHYFELCERFWESGHSELARWRADVARGAKPNFGFHILR